MRPECLNSFKLNVGSLYNNPESLRFCESSDEPSPGIDTELFEEVEGEFGAIIYDQGDDAGFVLVEET